MNVNEIFHSFQGEGPSTGKPSVFLRLSGCNLRCVFCDTKYTWLFSRKTLLNIQENLPDDMLDKLGSTVYSQDGETHKMSTQEVVDKIQTFTSKNLVITGGEPLLQQNQLIPLINSLNLAGFSFEVETNGTKAPISSDKLPNDVKLRYNVSPKLANSFNPVSERILPEILKEFLITNSIFKFVISAESDIKEIQEIADQISIPEDKIYLMPEATSKTELEERGKKVANLAIKNSYNYSHRLHILFYGDTRGV